MAKLSAQTFKQHQSKLAYLRRLIPQSSAAWAAVITALTLAAVVLAVWSIRFYSPELASPTREYTLKQFLSEALLVLLIPVCLYFGIRRWSQVIQGEFPDIDDAWQAGIAALASQGISSDELPIFLIIGSSSTRLESDLTDSLNTQLRVIGIPNQEGISHPLQWYVSDEAIYLFCPGASSLSKVLSRWRPKSTRKNDRLHRVRQASADKSHAKTPEPSPSPQNRPAPAIRPKTGSLLAPNKKPDAKKPPTQSDTPLKPIPVNTLDDGASYMGTIQMPDMETSQGFMADEQPSDELDNPFPGLISERSNNSPSVPAATSLSEQVGVFPAPNKSNTGSAKQVGMDVPPSSKVSISDAFGKSESNSPNSQNEKGTQGIGERAAKIERVSPKSTKTSSRQLALPADLDASEELPRLRYLCQLIQRQRRPRCGINGLVTLVPFEIAGVGPLQLSALSQASRSDLNVIQKTLGIRVPVTTLLVGMEEDRGFVELIRRLQPDLLERRLGGRFDLRSRPTPEELNDHSDQLCDDFESWIYRLFAKDEALAEHRGNRKLYELISRIRYELKPRLRIFLGQAFGCDSREEEDVASSDHDDGFFYSGCYFAAASQASGHSAFVRGVLHDKLIDEQSMVEWTTSARQRARLQLSASRLGWLVTAILIAALIIQLSKSEP